MVEALAVTHGGRLIDSDGCVGVKDIRSHSPDWVDYSGTLGTGVRAGLALFPHASTIGYPWTLSDFGTLTMNPMEKKSWVLMPGKKLNFGIRIVLHDGNAQEALVRDLYREFIQESKGGLV